MDIPNNSPLRKLDPVLDGNGLLRIGGRLHHSTLTAQRRRSSLVTATLAPCTSTTTMRESSTKAAFSKNELYAHGIWIVGAKRCIARHLHKCVRCNKLQGKTAEQKMADLPADRLSTELPFTNVGVDAFGPWSISSRRTRGGAANSKMWAVMFTCLSICVVHIELIEAMDTSSFINALHRFLAIRGTAKLIRSDKFQGSLHAVL